MSERMGPWEVVTEPPLPSHCVCVVGADGDVKYYVKADPREHGSAREDAAMLAAAPELAEELHEAIDDLREVWARIPVYVNRASERDLRSALIAIGSLLLDRAAAGWHSPALAKARGEATTHAS